MTPLSQPPERAWQEPVLRRATPADAAALSNLAADTFIETFRHRCPPADLARFLADFHRLGRGRVDPTPGAAS